MSRPSMRWELIVRLAVGQAILTLALVALLLGSLWAAGLLRDKSGRFAAEAVAASLVRAPDGALGLQPTAKLKELQRRQPGLSFLVRDGQGRQVAFGPTAPEMAQAPRLLSDFPAVARADFWLDARQDDPQFHLDTVETPVGTMRMIVDVRRPLTFPEFAWTVGVVSLVFILPLVLMMALISLWATTVVVRRSFRRLDQAVRAAEAIDARERRVRLPDQQAPAEIAPLILAINRALDRLDEGYERQARFLADAAHELRTPIAIVQARIDGLGEGSGEKWSDGRLAERLRRDVTRLATLAEQLLDLQRMDRGLALADDVDLAETARHVAADLAPIVIAAGGEVEVVDRGGARVRGDRAAIERMLTNLVQNAVEHGGRRVLLRIEGAVVEVEDDGPGVPAAERERIFEPFHRLRSHATGAGLGLSLVRQMMDSHRGRIAVDDAPDGGTIMRLEFAAAPPSAPRA